MHACTARRTALSLIAVLGTLFVASYATAQRPQRGVLPGPVRAAIPAHPSRVLVRFKPGAAVASQRRADDAAAARKTLRSFRVVPGLRLVEVPEGRVHAAIAAYRNDPSVLYAEPDYEVRTGAIPDDPDFDLLWGLHNTGQTIGGNPGTAGADIRAAAAWDLWIGDPDFRLAVIDTGVDYNHPDLAANIWTNPGEIPGNNLDDDGNGYIDDVHGYDFANGDPDPMDDRGHGTHCAGTIGAVGGNAVGVAGVNWRCRIVAVKFLGADGAGAISSAVASVQYVIDNGIRLSSNSWGGGGFSQALRDAIQASQAVGHLFVAAAGNSAVDNDVHPHYPSSYDLPNVVAVAATDNDDQLAVFSNWGLDSVHLGAPGVRIYSTIPGSDYAFLSGTSMATPHVSGVFALLMSRSPHLTWSAVRDRVLGSVRPVSALVGTTVTGGVVSAVAALGDCNANGTDDAIDISTGASEDCTGNGVPDECEPDCNANNVADSCDILSGFSTDCDGQGWPDECEPDCNANGIADQCDIGSATSEDCNANNVPDECEPNGDEDCNANGTSDLCDLFLGLVEDCNRNDVPDSCDISAGDSGDCNGNAVPDECETALHILLSGDASLAFTESLEDLGHIVTRIAGSSGIFPLDLSPYDVVILGPGGMPFPEDFIIETLDEFVHAGGGLIRIQDPPDYWFQYYGLASPITAATGFDVRAGTQVVDAAHPIAAGLASTSALTGYSSVYTLRPEAETVIAWNDGTPMTVSYRYGAGRSAFLNDLWAAYPGLWEGDQPYGRQLMDNVLRFARAARNDCNANDLPDDCDILAGTSQDCSGNGTPDECERDCNENGIADSCDIQAGTSTDLDGNAVPDECSQIFYVDPDAAGNETGLTWTDAFTDLQAALDNAGLVAAPGVDTQIWVADGVYRPSRRADPDDPRSATFRLVDFVSVFGGFAGGEARLFDRNVRHNATILSGDLAGDDGPDFTGNAENAYHVVTASETGPTAVLDGFTVTGGNAYEGGQFDRRSFGGGIHVFDGSPTILNATIVANRAFDGAGMWLQSGNSLVVNCTFAGNRAGRRGGAIEIGNGDPRIVNGVFTGNSAGDDPGYYGHGGAVDVRGSGGPVIANCSFSRNETVLELHSSGGAIHFIGFVEANVDNCILWNNRASQGSQIGVEGNAVVNVNHSNVQGGWFAGTGNINADPRFVDADGLDALPGTADDNLRLAAGSPCIDAGDNAAVPDDLADLDRDTDSAEPTALDHDGAPRFFEDPQTPDTGAGPPPVVDIGAHEHGDCNGNDVPDFLDVADATSKDCNGNGVPDECESDCNGNGVEDQCDIAADSDDCNANVVPDECEPDTDADGRIDACDGCPADPAKLEPGACGCGAPDVDSDGDAVLDCDDLCPGFDDALDADADTIPDGCDQCPGHDDRADCNGNDAPDGCDLTGGQSLDRDGNGVPDECDMQLLGDGGQAPKNRVVSFLAPHWPRTAAVRIVPRSLYLDTDEDAADGCPPRSTGPDLSLFENAVRWLGPPQAFPDEASPPVPDILAAPVQCCPHFRDWSPDGLAASFPTADVGTIHVYGAELLPCSRYDLSLVESDCPTLDDPACSSNLLTVSTARWGDTWAPFETVNVTDVTKLVDKFRGLPYDPGPPETGAPPKVRAILRENVPPLDQPINVTDITLAVDAFRGLPYRASGPAPCDDPCG